MMLRFVRLSLVAGVALLGVPGCSGGDPEPAPPPVASIVRPSATPPVSASAARERPRQRLDDTESDYQALIKPFQKCMRSHGMVGEKMASGWNGSEDLPQKQRQAQEACEALWPLPPWEQDPANPEAKDFTRAVVKCLKNRGVRFVEPAANGIGIEAGGARNDERSITLTGQFLDACQREVAARK